MVWTIWIYACGAIATTLFFFNDPRDFFDEIIPNSIIPIFWPAIITFFVLIAVWDVTLRAKVMVQIKAKKFLEKFSQSEGEG